MFAVFEPATIAASMAINRPKAIDDANFDFYGKTLNGQPAQRERWKRSVEAVNGALGEAVQPVAQA